MRTSALLLAAAATLPAPSQAELIINGNWDTMAADTNSTLWGSNSIFLGAAAATFTINGNIWYINSIKVDGIWVEDPMYTPNAADFTLTIKSGSNAVVGSATGSFVGPRVSNGDGTNRIAVTFSDITGQPELFPGAPISGLQNGGYGLFIGLSQGSTLIPQTVRLRGYMSSQQYNLNGAPSMGYLGEVNSVGWNGPSPIEVYATSPFGAPPIPEPSTYGLILGGLALVGAAVRRRAGKNSK